MPLFSKRKSAKANSKGAKHAVGKERATLLSNNVQRTTEILQQHVNEVPSTIPERNNFLDTTIQRPPNSTAKCVANFPRRSRLSKSLPEVLVDDSVLPLFMEYLQKQSAQNVLNFWLAAETFCLSCCDKTTYYKSRLKKQLSSHLKSNSFNINSSSTNAKIVWDGNFDDKNQDCHSGNLSTGGRDNRNYLVNDSVIGNPVQDGDNRKCESPSTGGRDNRNSLVNDSVIENPVQDGDNRKCESPSIGGRDKYMNDNYAVSSPKKCNSEEAFTSNTIKDSVACFSVNKNDNTSDNILDKRLQQDKQQDDLSQKNEEEIKQGQNFGASGQEESQYSKTMMDDALSIYRHFISLDATHPLNGMDENIRRDVESNICSENGEIDTECFKVAQTFAFETLETRYFDGFLRSSYYQKHIMDILTSGKVFLADIMYNDNAVFYFIEFMDQEEKSSLLAFWFAVDSFSQELQSKLDEQQYNLDHALDDAMILYEKYFSMQATHSLGVGDETRIRIENKICREGGPLPDCFEEPMENILTLLEEVYFPIFLEGSVYFKYLNELFNTVGDIETACIDDSSSTASACETTKLLESLTNDVESQEDPDEIWQRPNIGLSIGRVNEYGIYEPGIEPQPGKDLKSGGSTFGQKMRKFVSGDSYKVKEDMAWQVAKMVLEDVKKQQKKARK